MGKIIPLLDIDDTRHLALRALNTITHHGGAEIRVEIAKSAAILTQLLRQFPDDDKLCELAVSVISHSVSTAYEGDPKPKHPTVIRNLDLADILQVVLETTKRPFPKRRSIIDHAVGLVSATTFHGTSAFKKYPHAVKFLVAGLRSKDWVTRSTCLAGIIRLHRNEHEEDQKTLDPNHFVMAISRGIPANLNDVLMNYGPTKSEMLLTLQTTRDFTKAMMQCAQDHNLYSLGMKLAPLILLTEFSVSDGRFETQNPVTGLRTFDSCGLPFDLWGDALKHCAQAIRAKRNPNEADWADILEIKWCIMRRKLREAAELAKKGIERNPEQAYFYYALTLMADNVQGLKSAKKGLKCKQTSPFVKYQMMQRAVEQAGDMGLTTLQEMPEVGDPKWEEGVAFLMSALEDSKSYIEGAPPDNRHMKNISYWYIVLTILTKDDLSPDLRELNVSGRLWFVLSNMLITQICQDVRRVLGIADDFSRFMGIEPPKTLMRLTQQAVMQHYASAIKEFSSVFTELDRSKEVNTQTVSPEKLEDDLAAWLNDMKLDDGTQEHDHDCENRPAQMEANMTRVRLYRCSWCGNPSAALRKCKVSLTPWYPSFAHAR